MVHFSSRIGWGILLWFCACSELEERPQGHDFYCVCEIVMAFFPRFGLAVGLTHDLGCCRSSSNFWMPLRVRFLLPFWTACVFLSSMFCLGCVFSFAHRLRVCSFPFSSCVSSLAITLGNCVCCGIVDVGWLLISTSR